ncbi:MAG: sulfotransferase [Phycisphaeraceae bacterium]|nr:sulfotransferase [Phycisphaeraceae bacterium]MCB9846968.1 sulfotransferase [Phycisphaeraceae bacterium]
MRLNPSNKAPVVQQAQALANERRITEAVSMLKTHLKKQRADADAMGLLGVLLADIGQGAEGRRILKKALRLKPRSADLRCRYGRVLAKDDQHDLAAAEFRAAMEIQPGHTWAIRCLVNACLGMHQYDEAYQAATRALAGSPQDPDLLIAHSRAAVHVKKHEQGLKSTEAVLGLPEVPTDLRVQMLFQRATFLAKLGRHDLAFAAYVKANKAAPKVYDAAYNAEQTDEMIRVWTRERIATIPVSSRKADQSVFIVGMPRSGTSLVEQIIASHPKAFGAGELSNIQRIVGKLTEREAEPISFVTDLLPLSRPNIENASKHYLDRTREMAPGAERITDKMPDNFRALGLIDRLLPGARVIHCTRDARDNCLSIFTLFFIGKENGFAYDLADLGGFYADYWRLMKHWKEVLDIPILEVAYEDMVADTESQSRRLIDFLGLEWDDRCLDFHKTKRLTKTLSADQVNKPIYKSSVARWKPYEKHLGPLLERLPPDALRDPG